MKQKQFFVLFGLIVIIAMVVRSIFLSTVPAGFYWDEVAILLDSKIVAETGSDMHQGAWFQVLYPSYGDYKLPVYIWLTSLGVKFISAADWIVRLPNVLAGLGTIVVAGLLARDLLVLKDQSKKRLIQLISMTVVAFLPWSIQFSRSGFEGHLGQFLFGLSIWFGLKTKQAWWWSLVSAVVGGLAVYSYFSVRFVWPIVFVAVQLLLINWGKESRWLKQATLNIVLPLAIFTSLLWPMFNSPLYQPSNQLRLSTDSVLNQHDYPLQANIYRQQAGNTLIDRALFHRHWLMGRELVINASDFLDIRFLFLTGDPNLRHGTNQFGLFLVTMSPFFVGGVIWLWKKHRSLLGFLMLWWFVSIIPAAVPEETPHALRSLNALLPLSLLVSFGLFSGWEWYQNWRPHKIIKQTAVVVVLSLMILNFSAFLADYFIVYPQQSSEFWQADYRQQAEQIWQDALDNPDQEIYPENKDDRFYLWLLLYGPLSSEQIQALEKPNYRPKRIKNIVLEL